MAAEEQSNLNTTDIPDSEKIREALLHPDYIRYLNELATEVMSAYAHGKLNVPIPVELVLDRTITPYHFWMEREGLGTVELPSVEQLDYVKDLLIRDKDPVSTIMRFLIHGKVISKGQLSRFLTAMVTPEKIYGDQ